MTTQPRPRPFAQVDVFSAEPYLGNPVAVVLDGSDLTDAQMAGFARWTNLSETTFVLPPTTPDADYRLRIWTPHGELPFAGHPTLGSARAWLAAGNTPRSAGTLVQECAAGLVSIHGSPREGSGGSSGAVDDAALSFVAPPTVRSGDLEDAVLHRILEGLGRGVADVVAHQWVDNGPGWAAVVFGSADEVLALEPDFTALGEQKVGVIGPAPEGSAHRFEVRAFVPGPRGYEDPVTGSLNAGLAQWLLRTGRAPREYVARQGTRLGRRGLMTVTSHGEDVLVGGACTVCLSGSVLL